MSLHSINDPKHWLDRAKEARALAEQIDDPEAKRTMLKNADDYERFLIRTARGRVFTMLRAVATTASRVSRCLEWIAISSASSGAFLGGNGRGNAAPSRVPDLPIGLTH
jgi:hypothetical protein